MLLASMVTNVKRAPAGLILETLSVSNVVKKKLLKAIYASLAQKRPIFLKVSV